MRTINIVDLPPFPKGCRIERLRINKRTYEVHANLVGPDGELLISATLEYINKQLNYRGIEDE